MARGLVVRALAVPPAITLARASADPALVEAFGPSDFAVWPDNRAMQADLQAGTVDLAIIPTNVAATLFSQGQPFQLVRVTVWGILHVLTRRDDITGWPGLAGRAVAVPLRGNMPDTIFSTLLGHAPVARDAVEIHYMPSYAAAMDAMLSGEMAAAVLPEPLASVAASRGARRLLDLQDEWGRLIGGAPRYPQAGAIVPEARWTPEAAPVIGAAIDRAVSWMAAEPAAAGALGAGLLGFEAAIVAQSLRRTRWESHAPATVRDDLIRFFTVLQQTAPTLLPEGLPGARFYDA